MSIEFPSTSIEFHFHEIWRYLYLEDGRMENPPINYLGSHILDFYDKEEISNSDLENNNLIRISQDKTASDIIDNGSIEFDYKSEPDSFNKDFIKFPINTTEIPDQIDLQSHFYKYSFSDNQDFFRDIQAPLLNTSDFLMWRSDFLYMILYKKFVHISDNYQKCLKRARDQFQLNEKVNEESILHYLIKQYNNILQNKDSQLKIFERVKVSKDVADLYTDILIEFLTLKLETLPPETDKPEIVEPEDKKIESKKDGKMLYQLPEGFSLNIEGIKSSKLDIRETAVLFHLLKEHGAVIEYSDASYSKLVHYLSGHSAQNLRRKSGFGNIWEILRQSRNGESYSTLKSVRNLLENIIEEINNEIKD